MGPGGYRVRDFIRAGGVMTVLFLVVLIAMMNIVFQGMPVGLGRWP